MNPDSIWSRIANSVLPVSPSTAALLSPGDVQAGRQRGLLGLGLGLLGHGGTAGASPGQYLAQAIQGAQGEQDTFLTAAANAKKLQQEMAGKAVEQHMNEFKLAQSQRAAALDEQRMQVLNGLNIPQDATPEQLIPYLSRGAGLLAQMGDAEGAQRLAGAARDLFNPDQVNPFVFGSYGQGSFYRANKKTGEYDLLQEPGLSEAQKLADENAKARLDLTRQQLAVTIDQRQFQHISTEATNIRGEFDRTSKPFTDWAFNYGSMLSTLQQATAQNPTAFKGMIANLAATTDPRLQIRQGIIQYLEQVDPSVKGRFDIAQHKLQSGVYSEKILNHIVDLVEQHWQNNYKAYKARYDKANATGNPLVGAGLQDPDTIFGQSPKQMLKERFGNGGTLDNLDDWLKANPRKTP
jgi:hypothetical protein